MLVALCEPGAYGGGGTAFWSEEAAAPATEEVAPKPNPNPNPNPSPMTLAQVVQFGYITLFTSAFPLAGALALARH